MHPDSKLTKLRHRLLFLALLLLGTGSALPGAQASFEPVPQTPDILRSPLSLADAINVALSQSPNLLRAQKTLEAEAGLVIETRAIALPRLGIAGNYTAVEPSDVDRPPAIPGFTFGSDQSWRSQVKLVQSLYEGGRILSALRSARLLKDRSILNYQSAVADVILEVQRAYYAALLAFEQIQVQEASIELLKRELADTQRRFDAGTVPRFNVLRAEVELANARPLLSRARNQLRISRNVLANVLGLDVPADTREEIPFLLTDKLTADPYSIDLVKAISLALDRRTELAGLEKTRELRKEEVTTAKAGYKPALEAFGGYDAHSSMFSTDLTDVFHGWITGVQLRWDIFDGRRTAGRVKQARARYALAQVELDDAGRRIELEVRTAHSTFVEATEVLESQSKVLEQADEALRLAQARADAGTGTQLDVLGAQTALTQARTTQVQALHDYALARARLERAIGANIPGPSENVSVRP